MRKRTELERHKDAVRYWQRLRRKHRAWHVRRVRWLSELPEDLREARLEYEREVAALWVMQEAGDSRTKRRLQMNRVNAAERRLKWWVEAQEIWTRLVLEHPQRDAEHSRAINAARERVLDCLARREVRERKQRAEAAWLAAAP